MNIPPPLPSRGNSSKQHRAKIYQEHLQRVGYKSAIDKDGDVRFIRIDPRTQGAMELRIILWEDDAQYLNVVLPAFFTAPNDAIREMFLEVVNGVSQTTKISKVFFRGNELWAAAGTFVPNPEAGCAVLAHCIEDLELALRKFSESADMFLSMARK